MAALNMTPQDTDRNEFDNPDSAPRSRLINAFARFAGNFARQDAGASASPRRPARRHIDAPSIVPDYI
jgi:hypothetical protein